MSNQREGCKFVRKSWDVLNDIGRNRQEWRVAVANVENSTHPLKNCVRLKAENYVFIIIKTLELVTAAIQQS